MVVIFLASKGSVDDGVVDICLVNASLLNINRPIPWWWISKLHSLGGGRNMPSTGR